MSVRATLHRTPCRPVMQTRFRSSRAVLVIVVAAFAALAALVGVARPAGAAASCTPSASWGAARSDLASQVVGLINDHRAGMGLRRLALSPTLTASSVWKSLHMSGHGTFAHDDQAPPVARSAHQRAVDCGYRGT